MSALIGHEKAARILAHELKRQADILGDHANVEPDVGKAMIAATAGCTLNSMAFAYGHAADRMEQAMREEAAGLSAAERAIDAEKRRIQAELAR